MLDPTELLRMARRPDPRAAVEGQRLVNARFTAWNRLDPDALRALLHLPHVGLRGTRLAIRDSERSLLDSPDIRALVSGEGWDHSRLDRLDVWQASADKAHCVVQFGRHAANGKRYADGQGVYIVTCRDGRWGIQLSSATLRPIGLDDPDDAEAVATATSVFRRWIEVLDDGARTAATRPLVHLPFVELRGPRLIIHRSAAAMRRGFVPRGGRDSELRQVVVRERSAHKVTLEVEIARLGRSGSVIGTEAALTIVTELQGRWAVQAHSAIAQPERLQCRQQP